MHATVIMVGKATPASIEGVLGELAAAARHLTGEGIDVDVILVNQRGYREAYVARIATSAAAGLGLQLEVLESTEAGAWATQQLAFEHALKHTAPDLLVTLDAAGHHDARQVPDLVRACLERNSGVTIGSRWMRGGAAPATPPLRALLSRTASRLVAWTTGLRRIHDITTSLRVIRADAAELVSTDPASHGDYGFYCEFVAVAQAYGFAVDEVPITFRPRYTPVERLRLRDLLEFAADLRRIRRRVRRVRSEMQIDQATWAVRSGRMRRQEAEPGSEFGALEELEQLSGATRFTGWIVDALEPAFGPRMLDVGAGFGAVSAAIAERAPDRTIVAVEPAENVYSTLVERTAALANVETRQLTSRELLDGGGTASFDTVLYVNVLEHILDDAAELETAYELLRPGGHLALFVPAMPSLYGSLDFKSGHYRRYTRRHLADLLARTGFTDASVRYFDPLGVLPYWTMYRLLDVQRLDAVSSAAYDRVVVPLGRALERVVDNPPCGKNLVAIARRPN